MIKSSKLKSSKKRVKVKNIPAGEKKLAGKQMKKVKGGAGYLKIEGVDGEFTNSTKRGT